MGDWPRPSSPGGSTLSSSALLAPSNSQLLSSQSCPWSHGGCLHQEVMHTYPTSHQRLMTDKEQKVILPAHKINFAYNLCPRGPNGTTLKPSKPYPSFIFSLALFSFSCSFPPEHTPLIHCLLKTLLLGDPN